MSARFARTRSSSKIICVWSEIDRRYVRLVIDRLDGVDLGRPKRNDLSTFWASGQLEQSGPSAAVLPPAAWDYTVLKSPPLSP